MKSASKFLLLMAVSAVVVWGCSKKADRQRTITTNQSGTVFEEKGCWEKGDNRIYTVFVSKEDWEGMEEYAEDKLYRTGRTTSVLFFDDRDGTPDVTRYKGSYSDVIDRIRADGDTTDWIARWDRFPSGEGIFKRYPGK